MEDNKRKLYDALSEEYDLGSFEQFSSDIQDDAKRRKLYDATSEEYDYGDYDSFSEQLGFGPGAQKPEQPAAQPQAEPAAPTIDEVKGRKGFMSGNPAIEQAYQQATAPKPQAQAPVEQQAQAPAAPRDFGVQNYYEENKQAAANQPKPSLETEKTTAERNLDSINQKLAEDDFPEIQDENGNTYKVIAASGVEDNGTLHLIAKDKDGKEVELTAKDYADFMPDNTVEGRNKRQMQADRAEIERLNRQIEARKGDKADRKDEDFIGPVLDKKTSKGMIKDLEAQKQRALYRLDNNPEYQKAIAGERKRYAEQMQELDAAFEQSGGGTGGRTVEEVYPDFDPNTNPGDARRYQNEQVYNAAARMLQDADDIMSTGLRYADDTKNAEFLRAAGKDMASPDFWTLGITDIVDNMTFRNVMERYANQALAEFEGRDVKDPLSPIEEKLVEAYLTRANAMMIRSEDQSQGSKMGKGAAESLKFMIDMALSGGLGKAVTKGAAEAFTKKAIAKFGRKLASMGTETGLKAAGKAALKEAGGLGIKLAGDVIETVPKVALSPLTAQSITEQATQFNQMTGQFDNSWGKSILKGTAAAGIEKFSELHGGIYERAAKNLFKVSGANALYNTLVSKDLRKTFSDWAKKTSTGAIGKAFAAGEWDGLFEMAEEMENAAMYQLLGEKDAWSDFWTRDNWLEMLGSFAPMTVFGMGANAGQNIYANRKFEKTLGVLGEMGFNTDALRDVARTSTVKDLAAYLSEGLGSVQNGALAGTIEGVALSAEDKKKAADAVADFMKAAVRMQALDGLYQGQQQQRMEDKRAEIEQAVGGKQFWKDDGTVEIADLANGEQVYVVSAPNKEGRVAVLHMDGTPGYITIDDLASDSAVQSQYGDELTTGNEPSRKRGTTVMSLDEYLSLRVMTDRQNQEAARMGAEREQQVGSIAEQYPLGQEVTYKSNGKTVKGRVMDNTHPESLSIQKDDGTIEDIPWEEVATWTGQTINVQTDEEQEYGIAGLLEAGDDARSDVAESINAGLEPGSTVQDSEGNTYEVLGFDKDSIDLEKGTAKFTLRNSDGAITTMDLPFADFIKNGMEKGAAAAQAEADRLAAEQAAAEEEKKRLEAEKVAADKAKKEEEERKKLLRNPDKLIEENPEEFARMNDEKKKDGGADTRELFQAKIDELTRQVEEKAEQRKNTTVPSERDRLLDEANKLRERIDRYRKVIDSYNPDEEAPAEPAPAPVQPQTPPPAPQGPAAGGNVIMTPQERKDAAKKAAQEQMGAAVAERVEKFMNSRKILGRRTMRPFGGKMRKAHYVLVEADAPIPSHDALNNFAPLGENSRDYGESQQKEVLRNAQRFSAEALHDMPTLRQDGLVPEGNGRTMMSQVAAANHDKGWDKDYLEALEYEADTYGFTPEDLASFEHPRVYIMFDEGEEIEMTARNMHQSNLDEKKGESKAQVAVRLAKLLRESPRALEVIMDEIYSQMEYDPTKTENGKAKIPQLTEVTKKPGVVANILKALVAAGAITESNIANYVNERDNTGNKAFSELVENILLGMAFDQESLNILLDYEYSNNEAIQRAIARASALMAARLTGYFGEDYDMTATLNNAVELLYRAAKFAEASKLPTNADAVEEYLKDTTALFDEGLTFDEETVALARLIWNTKRETNGRTLYETLGNLIDQIGRIVNSKENAGGMFADMEEIDYESLQDLIKRTIFEKAGIKPLDNGQSAENAAPAGAQQQGTRVGEEDESGNEQPVQQGNVGDTVEAAPEEPAAEPAPAAEPESVEAEAPASEPATDNLVDEDEIAALEKEIADRLRSQLNSGIDPGILVLAGRLAVAYIERGAAKIADFAKKMVSQFGDAIRDYIQDAYETARRTLRRNGKANIVSQMDPEDVVDSFDVNNFDKAPAEAAPEQPKQEEKPKAEKPKKAKKATVDSIFAETTGQEKPAEEGSDEDFGGLFAQPIDNQENNTENSRNSEKESVTLREEDLGLDPSDYRTYMTPQAREFFAKKGKEDGVAIPELAFIKYASEDQVVIPVAELEKLPEIIAAEEEIKKAGKEAKERTGSESLVLTEEELQEYARRLLSEENGSRVGKNDYSGPVARERKAFIVIGRPAGGKSSVFADPLSKEHKARIIDSDTVKPWLKGYNGGVGANYVNAASAKVADEALMQAMQLGENIVIPKIGGMSVINEIALPLRIAGYTVELCFNDVTEEASEMRAASRFAQTGRYLSLQYLKSIGDKPLNTFKKFADKSIKESIDELSEKQVQELRRRLGRLLGVGGELPGSGGETGNGEGQGNLDQILQEALGQGKLSSQDVKLFDRSVWKNNVVNIGEPPITVWDSESGESLPGSANEKKQQAQVAFRNTVRDALLKAVETGEKPYVGITQLRKAARDAGMDVDERGATDALIQELVEDAIVRAARILNGDGLISGKSARERYDSIVKLYEIQPTIGQRSSERIAKQQYSTPIPMGFLADMFAWDMGKEVLEPTAGTGMMVINVPAAKVHANEIDPVRLEILRGMGFAEVTDQDATEPFPADRKYGAIIANPPFGSSGQEKVFDGKTFTKLEHIIALNALEAMKPDGKAAIIVGGNMEYNPNGSIKTDAKFWHFLYDHYNVKGVIDMDGKLYGRQGTTYPTRLILIDGKRDPWERMRNTVFAPVKDKAPRKAETFDDLYDIVDEISKSQTKTNGYVRTEGQSELPDNSGASGNADSAGRPVESGPNGTDGRPGTAERGSERGGSTRTEGESKPSGRNQAGERGNGVPVRSGVGTGVAETQPGSGNGQDMVREQGDSTGADREGGSAGDNGGSVSAEVLGTDAGVGSQRPQRVEEKRDLSSDKLHYVQHSGAFSLESVAPAPMVEAMDESLKRIEQEYGPIDSFVQKELGYRTKEELYSALAAEQVDSVAMAIYQMKNGQAMIIGDQTGLGKGRQMAALIRWAVKQGKKPIFVTQKAGLFSDMYRDLADIGSADLVPFIFNSDGDMTYEDKDGNMVVAYKHASPALLQQAFDKGELPEGCHYAIITYSQVSSGDAISRAKSKKSGSRSGSKKSAARPTPKADFLRKIAEGNYLLMDESHTAAGESNTGTYFQSLLENAAGATFASATFAKRPDTMPLYALRTSMSQANVSSEELIASIKKGGVALQEIMSRALTQTGQMVRRERDMSDVVTDWITIDDPETVQRARENYDKTIEAFNGIIKFQEDFVRPAIEAIAGDVAVTGGTAGAQRGTEKLGIDNTPFASKTYNYTKQLMLALKAEAVVDKVIEEIEAGRHPVIALESTMESGLKEEGYAPGDQVQDLTFASSLLRGLDSVMRYAIKDADGVVRAGTLTPEELGPAGEAEYYRLQEIIREYTAGVFASPLDLITMRLQDAGYKVGELTGRSLVVRRSENGGYVIATRDDSNKAKKKAAADFNSGKLDVLILNKAASTGISLHAFKKFKDQRQRTMILAQPMSDINDYMQMIGRIDRTGQVHRGYYINLSLPVAAEQRFNMMLSTKLKSLNANTAADQEGGGSVEAVDLLNKYGDQVVIEYLRDHLDIYEKLGSNALKTAATGGRYVEPSELDDYQPKEGDARRITGRVALLSTPEQEAFYDDVIQRYNDLIQYLDDTGTNDLKITTLPLRAETLSKKVSSKGVNPEGDNPFAKDAYVETVEMDNLRKPMKADEVKATIEKLNGSLDGGPRRIRQLTTRVTEDQAKKTDAENERYEKAKAKLREEIAKFTEKVMARKGQSEEDKQKDIREFVEDHTEKVEQKHSENLTKIGGQAAGFRRKLEMFQVGATHLVPDQLDNQMFVNSSPAIFCGFKVNESKLTPSTTFAVFAVLDGRRKVEVKLSQPGPMELIKSHSQDNWGRTREVSLGNWDEKYVNTARKKGHIMTGNILQAIADTQDEVGNFPGQLVSYTDIDGNVHDGVLMPDNWTPGQLRNSGVPINSKIGDVLNGLDVKSTDGKVTIESFKNPYNGEVRVEVYVPKSKKEGEKYFGNRELIDLTRWGSGFNTYRGKMAATIYGEQNIRKALDILSSLGVRVADESEDQDTTRQTRFRDGSSGEDVRFRIREDVPPTKTGIGYKVFVLKDGKLYPPMVANPNGASTPTGMWLDADAAPVAKTTVTGRQQVKAGGKGTQGGSGTLSYRPGWHLGEIPYAIQFNRIDENGEKTLFPKNFVWAEVEYAADVDYQQEAMSYGVRESGKFQHSLAGLPYLPKNGYYTYRTNPNPETDPWIITGAMRVKRLLTPTEVDSIVVAAGRQPQPRQAGAITDEQIERLNEEIERQAQTDPEVMDGYINDLADDLGVKVKIVRDVNEVKDDDKNVQRRKRRSKGFFDLKTGQIVLVLPNATSVADALATVFHEGVGHEGMRGLFGERFDKFLDDVYANAEPGMKARIDAMQDNSIKDETERRREATEEYIAEMAERGVEDNLEMSFWDRLKAMSRQFARALGIRFEFTDADIRYNLWKSKRYLGKKGESILEKADRVATDQELRREAEASYAQASENNSPEDDNTPPSGSAPVSNNPKPSGSTVRYRAASNLSRSSQALRDRAITNDTQDVALRTYGNEVMLMRNILREIYVDQYTAVRTAMRAIEKESGKEATAREDITKALNQLSSKQQAASERYANGFLKPLMETVAKVAEEMDVEFEDIIQYVCLRRALECNELYAKRDAKEYYQRKHDDAVIGVESRTDIDRATKDALIHKLDADLQNQLNDTERGMSDKYRELRGTDGKHEGKDYGATVSWFSEYVDAYGNRSDIVPAREPGEDVKTYQARLKRMRKPVAGAETLAGAEDLARQYVHDFETRAGGLSRELWDKINAATGEILRMQYDSHLITKEQYEDIKGRSQYYVPLRGFAEMTAEDAFSYVTDDLSDTFVPALMRAGGRISKPDSPFGFIAGMAASTINEAYKNMAIQALYRFIANRKDNSLAVISDSWYVPTGRMVTMADVTAGEARMEDLGKEIWEPAYPNLDPSMDMDTQKSVSDAFNADMEKKALLGQAAKGTAGLNLRNSFVFNRKANESQHFVRVKVLGEEKFIIFRGDPRAAQAINGILNPDTRQISAYSRAVRALARTMAKLCTSYSVPFWFSNFYRDGQTAIANTYEKEGPEYAAKMVANIPFALGVVSAHVKGGNVHIEDSWSDAKKNRVKRLYDEYLKYAAGGAITGYSVIFNHAEYDKQFKRAIREKKSELAESLGWVGDTLESIGTVSEGIEQVFRFATFLTSREEGRPMEQCIDDAKNVTVNFNRKGSYAAMEWKDTARITTYDKKTGTYSTLGDKGGVAATSERAFVWLLSQVAPWVRTRFMFVNPNIQGTYTTYSNWKVSAFRTASVIFGTALTSFLIHIASELLVPDPDDREKRKRRKIPYSHLTDYQRRSNIVLPELGGVRVTIPLSQEYAPFWAVGDIMASAALKSKYDQKAAWEVAKAIGEIMPVNVLDPTNIVPDPLAPAVEAVTNTNYQGRNIFQKLYNETTPDFKRAYNGTWEPLVDLSVALNSAMGGTNNVTPEGYGKVANIPFRWNNPAAWQHIIEGMGGTTVSALGDVLELAWQIFGEEDVKLSSIPIVNRFVKDPYEWGNDWYLNTEARKFKNLSAEQNKRKKALEKGGDMEALERLYGSDNWAITELYDTQYKKEINRLTNQINELRNSASSSDQEYLSELQEQLEQVQEALIKDVKNLLKDRK